MPQILIISGRGGPGPGSATVTPAASLAEAARAVPPPDAVVAGALEAAAEPAALAQLARAGARLVLTADGRSAEAARALADLYGASVLADPSPRAALAAAEAAIAGPPPRPIDDDEAALAHARILSRALASESRRAQEAEQAHRHAAETSRQLATLSDTLVTMAQDIQGSLDRAAQLIVEVIGDAGMIGLVSDDGAWLELTALHHRGPEERAAQPRRGGRQPLDGGIAARVIASGAPELYPRLTPEQMRGEVPEAQWAYIERYGITGMMVAPMRSQDRSLGLVCLFRYTDGPPYTEDDLLALQEMANRTALALSSGRLYAEVQAELERRRQTETALREVEHRYELIANNVGDVIWVLDVASAQFTYFSPSVTDLLGYTPEEAARLTLGELLTTDSLTFATAALPLRAARFERGDESARVGYDELELRHRSGAAVPAEVMSTLLPSEDGQVRQLIGIARGTAHRRLAELVLRESEERLRIVTETARIGLALVDADHRYRYANQTYRQFLNIPHGDLAGQLVADVLGPLYWSTLRQRLDYAFRGLQISGYLIPPVPPGAEERRYAVRIEPTSDSRGPIAVVVLTDITERDQAVKALRDNEEQLRLVYDAAELGTWRHDAATGHYSLDARARRHYGLDHSEAAAADLLARIHPDDRARSAALRAEALAPYSSGRWSEELRVVDEGGVRWLAVQGRVHFSSEQPDRRPVVSVGTTQDITARKEGEARAQAQARRLAVLAEASRAFAEVGTDERTVLELITRTAAGLLGDTCAIRFLSDDGERLVPAALHDADPELMGRALALWGDADLRVADHATSAEALASGEPRMAAVVGGQGARPEVRRLGFHSTIVAPLRVQGQVVGLLYLVRHRPDLPAYTADDLRLGQDLAERAGLALSNARLFAQAREELAERTRAAAEVRRLNAELEQRVAERTAEVRRRTEIIDQADDAIIIREFRRDTITYWNRGAELLYGWSAEEARGQHIHTLLQTSFPEPLEQILASYLRDGIWEGTVVHRARDGRQLTIMSHWTLQLSADGRPEGWLEINRDITERVAMEQQVRRGAERATILAELSQALVETSRELQPTLDTIAAHIAALFDDVCVVSLVGEADEIVVAAVSHPDPEAQAAVAEIFSGAGTARGGMASRVAESGEPLLIPRVDMAQARAAVAPAFAGYLDRFSLHSMLIVPMSAHGRTRGTIGVARARPGEPYTAEDQRFLQELADRAGLAVENADLYNEALRAREEADRANTAKSAFLASMSHELRTPLNAIIGFTGTLLMRLPGPLNADQEKQLGTVQTSARHLLALINDLLDLAKVESGKTEVIAEPLAAQPVLEEVTAGLRPLAERKGLRFAVVAPAEPVTLTSDRRALSQILINLIQNALKFTDEGGVTVTLRRCERAGRRAVAIDVADTGIGISAEDQGLLFREFGRVGSARARQREGTGLGLLLSQRLARMLGGEITLESEIGVGSTFTLTLPE